MQTAPGSHAPTRLATAFCAALSLLALGLALLIAWPRPGHDAQARTFAALLSPLAPGRELVAGFVVAPPRRGDEHDVVLMARRDDGAHVELHVLDKGRWADVRETASFAVGYETPRSSARPEEREAAAEALARVISANDPGGLGPVDNIPLAVGRPPTRFEQVVSAMHGWRGALCGALIGASLVLMATSRAGVAAAVALLFVAGLALRAHEAGLPFVRDQDVQRALTGALPIGDIALGHGLEDRHPPLYFFVMHAAQWFGQGEAVLRAPAIVASALTGPAIAAAGVLLGGPAALSLAAGLCIQLSPALVAGSREVSDIPLFALLAVLLCAMWPAAAARGARWALGSAHALLLYTYHVAFPVQVGAFAVARLALGASREAQRAALAGVAAGLPALLLLAVTVVRDSGARQVAAHNPGLAWGDHTVGEMAEQMARLAHDAVGAHVVLLSLAAGALSLWRRDARALLPLVAALTGAAAVALAAPFARVQPYYVQGVLPLLLLSIALAPLARLRGGGAAAAAVTVALAAASCTRLHSVSPLWQPDEGAYLGRFADRVLSGPTRRVAVVAHYDATLLLYELGKRKGVRVDWRSLEQRDGVIAPPGLDVEIVPLTMVHAIVGGSEDESRQRLRAMLAQGDALVLERDAFMLESVHRMLQRCEVVEASSVARMYRCGGGE